VQLRSLPVLLLASALLFAGCRKEAEPKQDAPAPTSASAMQTAAEATAKRLQTQAARWFARHAFGEGRTLEVGILDTPDGRRRIEFTVIGRDGNKGLLARIVERDGLWYVTEGDTSAVYRPYQAPLQLPALYVYLARSDLQLFHANGYEALGTLAKVDGNVASFRAELPEGLRERLEAMAVSAEKADAGASAAEARAIIANGLQTRIDLSTGVVLRAGVPGAETELEGPYFFTTPPPTESFDVGDLVPGLLASSVQSVTESLVMIAHCGAWRPGAPGCDLDTALLELKHGALRRVPFMRGTSLPGSFLPDRTRVLVSGTEIGGGMRPVEVNLINGGQRVLGGKTLLSGMTLFPTASPDGSRAVATWLPALDARNQARVVLFALDGTDAQPIGEPMEHSHVQWLPDGEGLILAVRTPAAEGQQPEASIAKLSLDGKLEVLRKGDQPLLLGSDALLFFDRAAKVWMRSKLDGSGAVRFGDGHAALSAPTLAPGGRELVFLQRLEDGNQVPVRVDLAGKSITPLMVEGGLWAWPRW